MSCECPVAGYCDRHKINKSRRLHDLCQSGGRYWDAWEADRGPCQAPTKAERRKPKPRGPGSFLAASLKEKGYAVTYKCGCESKIRKMNKWGVDGCRRRLDTICGWIENAATDQHWKWAVILNTPGIAWKAKREIRAMIVAAIDAAEVELQAFVVADNKAE